MSESKKRWKCAVCGYIHEGAEPPEECPICAAPEDQFVAVESADNPKAKQFRCVVCGYIHDGAEPPPACPICGAPDDQFEPYSGDSEESPAAGKFDSERTFIIIGGGIAGIAAAEMIREYDMTAAISLYASEESLPYYRLNLTPFMAGKFTREELTLYSESWYKQKNISLQSGIEISSIDPEKKTVTTATGNSYPYDRLIVAAGAKPFIPPLAGSQLENVICMRTDQDAEQALNAAVSKQQCIVIGGGLLGLETAAALASHGAGVTVIEFAPYLLPRQLTPTAAALLKENFEQKQVTILTQETVLKCTGETHVSGLVTENNGIIAADLVVIAAGVRSNLDLVADGGFDVNRGVIVDDHMKTSQDDIYAAGDIAEHNGTVYGLWTMGLEQGAIAGANAAGETLRFVPHPPPTLLKVAGIDVFSIGHISSDGEEFLLIENVDGNSYTGFVLENLKLVGAVTVNNASGAAAIQKAVEETYDCSSFVQNNAGAREIFAALTDKNV